MALLDSFVCLSRHGRQIMEQTMLQTTQQKQMVLAGASILGGWEVVTPDIGLWGIVGGRGWVWEKTIAYFGEKVCWKVIIFQKKEEKFAKNVGVNGEKWKFLG